MAAFILPCLALAASPDDPARPPITVECANGHDFRLATGSELGACKVYEERGRVIGGYCTDGENSARQTCATGCKEVTGSGSCEEIDPSETAARS